MVHVFNFYKEEFKHLVEQAKAPLPNLFRVEWDIKGLVLPKEDIILDLETTGLEPETEEIVSYGIAAGTKAWVVVRLNGSEEELLESLKKDLEGLISENKPTLWAFYMQFEKNWLEAKMGTEFVSKFVWGELKQMRGRLKDIVPFDFNDPFDGSRIPRLWENWKVRASLGSIVGIIHHNIADVFREAVLWALLMNKAFSVEEVEYSLVLDEEG